MLSIPDLVDNCPNNRQSGDKMTRVLAQFGKEKLVYMVDFSVIIVHGSLFPLYHGSLVTIVYSHFIMNLKLFLSM